MNLINVAGQRVYIYRQPNNYYYVGDHSFKSGPAKTGPVAPAMFLPGVLQVVQNLGSVSGAIGSLTVYS